MSPPNFIFVTCQVGAEPAVKAELARRWPAFRFAFSRPGFLTFKLPTGAALPDDFDLHSVFARAHGFSLGKTAAADDAARAEEVWQLAGDHQFDAIHVWQRDLYEPGFRGYEPGPTELAASAESAIRTAAGARGLACGQPTPSNSQPPNSASPGQLILDCILVEPDQWWIGYHRAASIPSRWPGGLFPIQLPQDAVSRAYLKMEEALAWSRMPLKAGDLWAEIGSARAARANRC